MARRTAGSTIIFTTCLLSLVLIQRGVAAPKILAGSQVKDLEHYAAQELQRFMYQLSGELLEIDSSTFEPAVPAIVIGQSHTHPLIKRLLSEGVLEVSARDPGPEGYVLKTVERKGQRLLIVAGGDEVGCLYGVYGLLQDHFGVSFHFRADDALPRRKSPLAWPKLNERKAPAVAIRGILPWSNFPQSATVYSWEDWRFILDQMARQRLNFILIHNYNGEHGHNEMFHNFALDGRLSRVWMATARSGHGWRGPGWAIDQYRFGAGDLFDDYDFGADCALHNETLSNEEVFRKGVSLFQRVIDHAHRRGIKVGLGLDLDKVPPEYQVEADDPRVIQARVEQVARDYSNLDFFFGFQSEYPVKEPKFQERWRRIFLGFHQGLKERAPGIRIAASGWGLKPEAVASLPADVICAPIAAYSDRFESGAAYGTREYWGGPWLEKDNDSSQYYYPYNTDLANTLDAYRRRAPNMRGLFALTWRLTDAIDPKLACIATAPWDNEGRLRTAEDAYRQYALRNFGSSAASQVVRIINGNEPRASTFAECEGTPPFLPEPPRSSLTSWFKRTASDERRLARQQLAALDALIAQTKLPEHRQRLDWLRCRIAAAELHLELNDAFQHYQWRDLPGAVEPWVRNFTHRVTDISSLGNVSSVQNRYIQLQYEHRENAMRARQAIKSPSDVSARGTRQGAVLEWKNEHPSATGFNVYRDGRKRNASPLPSDTQSYPDEGTGRFRYTVRVLDATGVESEHSIAAVCEAGAADKSSPVIVVISPPTSVPAGQPAWIKARVLDGRSYDSVTATLVFRPLGAKDWRRVAMPRRVKSIFATALNLTEAGGDAVEYFVESTDGDNHARFPVAAPHQTLSLVVERAAAAQPPKPPENFAAFHGELHWQPTVSDVFTYRVYRARSKGFLPGPENFVTYLPRESVRFADNGWGFDAHKLAGTYFYRITAADRFGNESEPTPAVPLERAGALSSGSQP